MGAFKLMYCTAAWYLSFRYFYPKIMKYWESPHLHIAPLQNQTHETPELSALPIHERTNKALYETIACSIVWPIGLLFVAQKRKTIDKF